VTFQPLVKSAYADARITVALGAQVTVENHRESLAFAVESRGRAITKARAEGVTLAELARAFGKSIEWVRQAEKKG
jgi:hypothetical protein